MRVLFLDIDGPLAIGKNFMESRFYITPDLRKIKSFIRHKWDSGEEIDFNQCVKMPYGWHGKSCKTLADLIKEEDLKVVISSDWRRHYSEKEIGVMFDYYKIPSDSIVGMTSKINWGGGLERARMAEIEIWVEEWKKENPEENLYWVTVDDMNMIGLGENHYVKVLNGLSSPGIKEKVIDAYKDQL